MSELEKEDREILRKALSKCTDKQISMFNRMYGSVDKIPYEKMDWAYSQIMKSLKG